MKIFWNSLSNRLILLLSRKIKLKKMKVKERKKATQILNTVLTMVLYPSNLKDRNYDVFLK